jgi:hypothetical protein
MKEKETIEGWGVWIAATHRADIMEGPWTQYCGDQFTNPKGKLVARRDIHASKAVALERVEEHLVATEAFLHTTLKDVREQLASIRALKADC